MATVITTRRDVRSLIFHFLYAMESFDYTVDLSELIVLFNEEFDLDVAFDGEVAHVVRQVVAQRAELDKAIEPLLSNWTLQRLGCCTLLILRLAIWELQNTDTAPIIVINEAIELAKCFSEKDAYKFINGVLDRAIKTIKQKESSDTVDQEPTE